MKISPVDPDIICLKRSLKTTDCTHLLFLNSAVNGRKFTKVLHDVTRSLHEVFKIRMAISKAVSKCQGDE